MLFRSTTNTYTLSGLTPETDYYIYVSNLCSTTDTSIWVSYAITTPAMLPYACDFEQANHSWIFVNGTQGNKFVVDTAIAFGGNKSLYISDNEGVSNTYSTPTSLSSTVYAYKEVYFEPGTYEISYQWRCLGEVSNDYARVFLFPSNKSLTAGTNILYTVSNPTNALAVLDQNVQLNNSAAWQENQTRFKVNAAGIYKVVVGWRNSNSVNNNPPIAIDDVVIEEVMCLAPLVQTSDITISSASLEWFSNSDTILFKVSKELFTLEQIDTVTNNLICNEKIFNKNYALSGLEDYTTYYIYSRVLCSSGDTSEWNIEPFTTQLMVINAPCSFDFETDAKFYLVNGNQRNYFVVGNGVSANGNNSLYITNDGTLNAYSTNLSSVVYATKVINFEQGEYIISYNWLCNAESGYDYGRVFLAPETATITNSTSFMSLTSAPTGWIALDNYAQMSNNTSWSNQEVEFNISTTGNYQLVIGWTNDGSMGVNPPLAIDDIEITKVACMAPIVTTDSITTDAIYLDVVSQTDSFVIFISSTLHSDMYLETVQTTDHVGNKFDFQGLSSQTNYYIYTRSVCSDSTFSNWAINLFRTSCADIYINDTLSYVENFDSYGTLSNTQPECWFNNTTSSYVYPNISTTKYNGVGSLYFYGSSLVTTYSATSKIEGTPINELMMTLRLQVSTLSYHILVGVMSNPDDVNTFITVDSLYCSAISIWEYKEVDFSNYSGEGKHIAFKVGGKVVSYAYVDNVEIKIGRASCRERVYVLV